MNLQELINNPDIKDILTDKEIEYIAANNRLYDRKRIKEKLEKHFKNVAVTGRGKNTNIEIGERVLYKSNDSMHNELYTNALYLLCSYLQGAKVETITKRKTLKKWGKIMQYPESMQGLKFEESFKLGYYKLDLFMNTDFKEPDKNNYLTVSDVIQYNGDLREFRRQVTKDVFRRLAKATGAKVKDIFIGIRLKFVDKERQKFVKGKRELLSDETIQLIENERDLIIEQYDKINIFNVYDSAEYKMAIHEIGYYKVWREYEITINTNKLNKLIQELEHNPYIDTNLTPEQQEQHIKGLYKQSYYKHLEYTDRKHKGKLKGYDENDMNILKLDSELLLKLEREELKNILHYRRYKGQALEYYRLYEKALKESDKEPQEVEIIKQREQELIDQEQEIIKQQQEQEYILELTPEEQEKVLDDLLDF